MDTSTSSQTSDSATFATPDRIVELGYAYWGARALHVAVELGVFTELAHGPLDRDALRVRVGVHPRGARDFFDAPAELVA